MNKYKFFSAVAIGSLLLLSLSLSTAWLARAATELTNVFITGPKAGKASTVYTFTATVSPISATLPITYAWQATGQTPVTHSDILSHTDVITFIWNTMGTQTITVTASNSAGAVIATATLLIATLIVSDDYPTIQQAVDAASPGDLIFVRAGTYPEHVTITKLLTLQGEDQGTTIIDGSGSGTVLFVNTDGVVISGFTVRNGSPHGIHLYQADNCQLKDVVVTSNSDSGIYLQISTYNTVANSIVSNNTLGLHTGDQGSHHNTFQNVTVYSNTSFGLVGYAGSHYTQLLDSIIYDNPRSVAIGWSQNWTIENTAIFSSGTGIYIDTGDYTTVKNCEIYSNTQGVRFTGFHADYHEFVGNRIHSNTESGLNFTNDARYNTVKENEIYDNGWGVYINYSPSRPSHSNVFYHNSFMNNTTNALVLLDDYTNTWDDGYPSGGNYWDDYTGVDLYSGAAQDQPGSDGIGDTSYVVTSTTNIDRYPMIAQGEDDVEVYLPLILKPGMTTLYIQTINTGGATIRIFDLSNNQLLSCAVADNTTQLCGTFPSIGSYKITAQTVKCGLLGPTTFHDAIGGTITRIVQCY